MRAVSIGCLGLIGFVAAGCPGMDDATDCASTKTCAYAASDSGDAAAPGEGGPLDGSPSLDAASDGDAGVDTGPQPGCDKTPREDAATVVTDRCGVFVSPTGNDSAIGTKADPFKTLSTALSHTRGTGNRIYVCGTSSQVYAETLALTALDSGRQIFGGLTCDAWTYDEAAKPNVRAPAANTNALVVDGTTGLLVEDLAFTALDASGAGASSIAVFVRGGADVTMHRVKITAGKGVDGTNGADGNYTFPSVSLDGNPVNGTGGGGVKDGPACPGVTATSRGGRGKDGLTSEDGTAGLPSISPSVPPTATGAGGTKDVTCGAGGTGKDGSSGPEGAVGGNALVVGTLTLVGWQTASGGDGKPGAVAQGGGGGGGPNAGAGGGGAAGGCGGAGGAGGLGGGGSIGCLVLNAMVTLDTAIVTTSDGGKGGAGGAGQGGEPGGSGSGGANGGCAGGSGGTGGTGAHGGGGAGGVSVPVLYKSASAPSITNLTAQKGQPGAGGAGATGSGIPGANDNVLGL